MLVSLVLPGPSPAPQISQRCLLPPSSVLPPALEHPPSAELCVSRTEHLPGPGLWAGRVRGDAATRLLLELSTSSVPAKLGQLTTGKVLTELVRVLGAGAAEHPASPGQLQLCPHCFPASDSLAGVITAAASCLQTALCAPE